MRTTLDLSPEAYHVARAVARERDISLGKAVSEFILNPPSRGSEATGRSAAGFPVFASGRRITSEDVARMLEED